MNGNIQRTFIVIQEVEENTRRSPTVSIFALLTQQEQQQRRFIVTKVVERLVAGRRSTQALRIHFQLLQKISSGDSYPVPMAFLAKSVKAIQGSNTSPVVNLQQEN